MREMRAEGVGKKRRLEVLFCGGGVWGKKRLVVIRQAYCFLNECALCGLSDFVPLHVLKVMPNQTTFLLALGIMNILQVEDSV